MGKFWQAEAGHCLNAAHRGNFADNYLLNVETNNRRVVLESFQSVVPVASEENAFFSMLTKKFCNSLSRQSTRITSTAFGIEIKVTMVYMRPRTTD